MAVDPDHVALEDALRQIALIDHRLRAQRDEATLGRFGEAETGLSIAALLGHTYLTTAEARVVDQLSRMPGGTRLVRTYLRLARVPHLSDVRRFDETDEGTPSTSRACAAAQQSSSRPGRAAQRRRRARTT